MPSRFALIALAVTLLLAACSGISFDNERKVEGTYTLRSVNKQPPPLTLDDRDVLLAVTSGVLTLKPNGEWSEVLTGTITENGQSVPKVLTDGGQSTSSRSLPRVDLTRSDGRVVFSGSFWPYDGGVLELRRVDRQTLDVYQR